MKNFIKEWVIPVAIVIVLSLLIQKFLFFQILVPTGSMKPTINEHDRVFVTKIYDTTKLKTGDIVVFKVRPNGIETLYVKRLIGKPGDTVTIEKGKVSVNGKLIDEPYVKNPDMYNGEFKVPENKFFFMGDNRINSRDSRYPEVGYIDRSDIIAKAGIKIWPINEISILK